MINKIWCLDKGWIYLTALFENGFH